MIDGNRWVTGFEPLRYLFRYYVALVSFKDLCFWSSIFMEDQLLAPEELCFGRFGRRMEESRNVWTEEDGGESETWKERKIC